MPGKGRSLKFGNVFDSERCYSTDNQHGDGIAMQFLKSQIECSSE